MKPKTCLFMVYCSIVGRDGYGLDLSRVQLDPDPDPICWFNVRGRRKNKTEFVALQIKMCTMGNGYV